ncbi:hypothetical protein JB92DRAFT_2834205 [Gautieria morchelliformis]|nr:hypothetical protein JB92DRAFT_2834205 [Gautieria morchelliformis]
MGRGGRSSRSGTGWGELHGLVTGGWGWERSAAGREGGVGREGREGGVWGVASGIQYETRGTGQRDVQVCRWGCVSRACAGAWVWVMLVDGWMARRGGEGSKRVMQDGWAVYRKREIPDSLVPLAGHPAQIVFSRPGLGSKAPVTAWPETARASQNPGRAFFYGSGPAPARLGFGPGSLEHGRRVKNTFFVPHLNIKRLI